ncbi:MAG: helix-turn-helix domain-containing protein [Methylobacterium organophilum]|nr:helix-turn-helix domain-containing protein [Methylobacterium organophilum]
MAFLPSRVAYGAQCYLSAVAIKAATCPHRGVKRTHKGPLRDVLAKNMRKRRSELELSQEALADRSGIHRTYVSGVERSERNVSIDNIARIAQGLGTEAWRLLKDD